NVTMAEAEQSARPQEPTTTPSTVAADLLAGECSRKQKSSPIDAAVTGSGTTVDERRQRRRHTEELTDGRRTCGSDQSEKPQDATVPQQTEAPPAQSQVTPAWLGKRNYFFRKWGKQIRQQLQMDEVASYSITVCDIADQ